MNKEEAIKYLQQLYPNGGHCWLDEQRIEAIGMAIKALQEEPVNPCVECASISEGCKEICYDYNKWVRDNHKEEPVSNSDWLTELQEKLDNATPEQLKELWNKYNGVDEEEPVSKDLEEAIKVAADETKLTKAKNGHPFFSEDDFNLGFSNGAQWDREKAISKACEWLKESVTNNSKCNRIISKKGMITMGLLIEDFRKYMEGE